MTRLEKIIDETGAGDIFLTTFVHYYLHFRDKLMAAAFASSVVSLFVEKQGAFTQISKPELDYRMKIVADASRLI